MLKNSLIIGLTIYLSFVSASLAEPSRTFLEMLNKPISLLEYGIFKIQLSLDQFDDEWTRDEPTESIFSQASYRWQENEIAITSLIFLGQGSLKTHNNATCKMYLNRLRNHLGYDGVKGVFSTIYDDRTRVPDFFYLTGDRKGRAVYFNERDLEIDRSVNVAIALADNRSGGSIICEGPLVSTRVLFSE